MHKKRSEERTMPILRLILGLLALLSAGSSAAQASYPEKPVKLLVGFPPGAQIDTVARLLGERFAEELGKPVVTENVVGVAGHIAVEHLARAAPDGYTLGFLGQSQLVINPILYRSRVSLDPRKDFAPISRVYASPNILVVSNSVPAKSVQELVALAKAQPGTLTFASFGNGSPPHVAAELFKSVAGIDIRHIPYKGASGATPDLLSGRVSMAFSPIGTLLPLVHDGKLRALGVTSLKRSAAAGDLATVAESGYPGFEYTIWAGLLAPAGTPAAIIDRLHRLTVKSLEIPALRRKLADLGLEAIGSSPDEFSLTIKQEAEKWPKVLGESAIAPK
jgi:tripartite-type tricarboxylate transporter receptor subunit TctC